MCYRCNTLATHNSWMFSTCANKDSSYWCAEHKGRESCRYSCQHQSSNHLQHYTTASKLSLLTPTYCAQEKNENISTSVTSDFKNTVVVQTVQLLWLMPCWSQCSKGYTPLQFPVFSLTSTCSPTCHERPDAICDQFVALSMDSSYKCHSSSLCFHY